MPSAFDTLFTTYATPLLTEHLGDAEGIDLILPGGGAGGTFQAILGAERAEESQSPDDREQRVLKEVVLPRAEGLPFWDAAPATNVTFAIAGVEYAVERVLNRTEGMVTLELVRRGTIEVSRPGYRRK